MERLASAEQATTAADSSSGDNGASAGRRHSAQPVVILCGDFNDSPSSTACQVQSLACNFRITPLLALLAITCNVGAGMVVLPKRL